MPNQHASEYIQGQPIKPEQNMYTPLENNGFEYCYCTKLNSKKWLH